VVAVVRRKALPIAVSEAMREQAARPAPRNTRQGALSIMHKSFGIGLVLIVLAVMMMLLGGCKTEAGSSRDVVCSDPEPVTELWNAYRCSFSGEPYTTKTEAEDGIPLLIIAPNPLPRDNSLKLRLALHGTGGVPKACTEPNQDPQAGYITIANCSTQDGDDATWWGPNQGKNHAGYRLAVSLNKAVELMKPSIDFGAGVECVGASMGGTGCILQAMLMPDGFWRNWLSVVDATVPHTNFAGKQGRYWRDPAVQRAWQGYDISAADLEEQMRKGRLSHVYFKLQGHTNDNLGVFDLDFLRYCDKYKVACFAMWGLGWHVQGGEPGVNLPWRDRYAGPDAQVRRLGVLPVFTGSTANHLQDADGKGYPRGHYNLGLSWNSKGVRDTEGGLTLPLRYLRHTDIGGGIPDQPEVATFDLTIRNPANFKLKRGDRVSWSIGSASGTVEVSRTGEVTIPALTLASATQYTPLQITRPTPVLAGITYTRQPRHGTRITVDPETPYSKSIDDASNWQRVNDVGRMWRQTEADVVFDDLAGGITVIHDCTGSDVICTAQEARISPDGKRVVYAVSTAPPGATRWPIKAANGPMTDLWEFDTVTAELWIYELDSGQRYRISSGHRDRTPDWCGNDCIVFASDRAGTYAPRSTPGRHPDGSYWFPRNFYPSKALHIHRARLVGRQLADITDITPGEWMALSPEVLSSGEVLFSAWEGDGPGEYGSTPQNVWWLKSVGLGGGEVITILGAHGSGNIITTALLKDWVDPARKGEGSTQFRALRATGEIHAGKIAVTNYYAKNSTGAMGLIFGLDFRGGVVEGALRASQVGGMESNSDVPGSAHYVEKSLEALTPYANDQDLGWPRMHRDGRAAGRAGYPAPLPGGGADWMYTHGRGYGCFEAVPPGRATYAALGGEPPCQKQIRRAKVEVVTNPFDPSQSEVMACGDLQWHCWDAQPVARYQDLYGVPTPQVEKVQPPGGECALRVVDARSGELYPIPGKGDEQNRVAFQGHAHPDYPAIVRYFGVEYFDHWTRTPDREGLMKTYPPLKAPLLADGSVSLPVECGRPFRHFGYDEAGDKVAHGLTPLVCNEGECTCHGCHDAHSDERLEQLGWKTAEERFRGTLAGEAE
tara:strand:- start:2428 stop:5778 length:3351 start_codon:yes stop_codon:yes gene_type:complete